MERLKQNYEEITELVFKVCYLFLTLATFITVIYASPVQPILVKVSLVLGMVLILIRAIKIRKYAKMPCVILMALFCLSFLFTAVMNRQYGITENGKWVIWTGIQFFALYVCDVERDPAKYRREFRILSHIMIVCGSLAAVAEHCTALPGLLSVYYHSGWGIHRDWLYLGQALGRIHRSKLRSGVQCDRDHIVSSLPSAEKRHYPYRIYYKYRAQFHLFRIF